MKIKFVKDRPGHDFRYALNSNKINKKLKWKCKKFNERLEETLIGIQKIIIFLKYFSKKNFLKDLV